MLNKAREAAGLPSAESTDAVRTAKKWTQAHAHLVERDEGGRSIQTCHAEGCQRYPVTPAGAHAPTQARKWWCPEHVGQAGPTDMEPWNSGVRFARSGGLEFSNEVEAEQRRQEREQERFRVERERRRAERAQEAEELRRHEQVVAEHYRFQGRGLGMTTAIGVPGTVYPGIPGHEARHLAAAVLLGLNVKEARADCPDPQTAGYVKVAEPIRTPREIGLIALVGNLDRGTGAEWPSKTAAQGDERNWRKWSNGWRSTRLVITTSAPRLGSSPLRAPSRCWRPATRP